METNSEANVDDLAKEDASVDTVEDWVKKLEETPWGPQEVEKDDGREEDISEFEEEEEENIQINKNSDDQIPSQKASLNIRKRRLDNVDNSDSEKESFREPIVDGRDISFKTKILNQFLVCSICMGYLKEAQTVTECLHTFCKSCIFKHFKEHSDCPRCDIHLGPYPMEKIKFDRQIQNLVDKIFPQLLDRDAEAEKQMLLERGLPISLACERGSKSKQMIPESDSTQFISKKLRKEEASKKFYKDEVGFELLVDEREIECNPSSYLRTLDKPFIRTSAKVTMKHLKKYLISKLQLSSNVFNDIEITYRGELLGNEYSLEYVLKSRGLDPSTKNPVMKYRTRRQEHAQLVHTAERFTDKT